ncbi:MAG: nucleoside recognition domain-containing protein [Eubacteriales bacterium]|nr:nucleoside recognition domain-containing protein [Eubacteriales bacterium]
MLNYIWFGLLALGIVYGIFNGKVEEITNAILESGGQAVHMCIGLLGIMCLWTGLMHIAEKSGIVRGISKAASPALKKLFPELPKSHPAMSSIVMNLSANFLGLGNAATPLGLKAMREMDELNGQKGFATNSMCMFIVMNTAAIQLIPTTVIALRAAAGSQGPADIVGPVWITSACTFTTAVFAALLFINRSMNRIGVRSRSKNAIKSRSKNEVQSPSSAAVRSRKRVPANRSQRCS